MLIFIQNFQLTVELGDQFVGLHEKRLYITSWRKRDKKGMIVHFAALKTYCLNTCRNKGQYDDFYTKFLKNCRVKCVKLRFSWKTFVYNFLKKTGKKVYDSPFCCSDNLLFQFK